MFADVLRHPIIATDVGRVRLHCLSGIVLTLFVQRGFFLIVPGMIRGQLEATPGKGDQHVRPVTGAGGFPLRNLLQNVFVGFYRRYKAITVLSVLVKLTGLHQFFINAKAVFGKGISCN